MSEWLRLVGELKRRSPQDLFTRSERITYDQLLDLVQLPAQRINLHGDFGTGKTFIAWGLARATGAVYVPHPDMLADLRECDFPLLIIDNAPTYEDQVRSLLADANMRNIDSVLFLTHTPTTLRMRTISLCIPTADEIEGMLKTLARLGFYRQHDLPPCPNLWSVLQACV